MTGPARRTITAPLGLGLLLTTEPVDSQAGSEPLSLSTRDLGRLDAGGVSQTDRFQSFGPVKGSTCAVPPGPATVQVYPGAPWYDVDLALR